MRSRSLEVFEAKSSRVNLPDGAGWASLVQACIQSQYGRLVGDRHERELRIKEEIRLRLKDVCSNLTETEFKELIDTIAANQLKSEYRPFHFESFRGRLPR